MTSETNNKILTLLQNHMPAWRNNLIHALHYVSRLTHLVAWSVSTLNLLWIDKYPGMLEDFFDKHSNNRVQYTRLESV